MDWVLTPDFQATIPLANWSLPAETAAGRLAAGDARPAPPDKTLFLSEDEAEALRAPALDEWQRAFR